MFRILVLGSMEPLPARLSAMLILQLSAGGGVEGGMDEYLLELADKAVANILRVVDDRGRAWRSEIRLFLVSEIITCWS